MIQIIQATADALLVLALPDKIAVQVGVRAVLAAAVVVVAFALCGNHAGYFEDRAGV